MRFGLLGPLEVRDDDGVPVDLGGRQPRTMLAVLLTSAGRPVAVDTIVDAIWGEDPPASATGTLQSYVSRLRRRLNPGVLVWEEPGYRLAVEASQVDHLCFEELADRGRALLDAGDAEAARSALVEAEELWRGPALVEFPDLEVASGLAVRLDQRRLAALEDRYDADLRLGRHAAVVGELTEAVAAHPLRERMQEQLALALYRSGRQADALRCLADASRTLRDELGIEPGRGMRELEAAILAHDSSLDTPASLATPAAPPPDRSTATPADERAADGPSTAGPFTRTSELIGRGAELAELEAALAESLDDARFAVVEGEPGIGKTRLVDELRALAESRGCVAVWGRSDEGGAAPALWPWLSPLRSLAGLGDVPPVLVELLAGETPISGGQAQALQFERFEAVTDLICSVTKVKPVVVLLDDLQWADTTSLELLAFLSSRLSSRVLIVGTVRQLEVGRNDAVTDALAAIARRAGSRRIHLRGLAPAATAEVLERAAGRSVAADVVAAIHSRSEGNPFYAIELARLLHEEAGASSEVPGSVGDVIRRRLARLPPTTVELLGVGAVVGRDVEVKLLARAADVELDEVLDGLEPAVAHRLLVEVPDRPSELRFSHALVREVLLEDLTSLRRARLHLKVADAIEARGAGVDDAEILAEHLWRAAPVGVGHRAAEALERAAEVALRRVAYAAAEDLLTKAVQLRRATSTSVEDQEAELLAIFRLLEVARARRYFQGAATSLDIMDRAKDLAERVGRRDILLDLLWFEWSALATASRAEAYPLAEVYRDLTINDPVPEIRASGEQVQGVGYWTRGRIADAVVHLDATMELLADVPVPTDGFAAEKRMVAHTFWLWNHAAYGDHTPEETFAHYDGLIAAMPDRFAVASICGFAATTALSLGRWDDAERYASIGLEADPGSDFLFWGGQVLMQRAVAWARAGRVADALTSFDEGKARYTGIGGRSGLCTFEASLAMCLAYQGHVDEARARAQAARTEFDTHGEGWNASIVLMAEAVVAHADGDEAAAADLIAQAVEVATEQGAHAFVRRAQALADEMGVALPA